jgi:hypothetical protein
MIASRLRTASAVSRIFADGSMPMTRIAAGKAAASWRLNMPVPLPTSRTGRSAGTAAATILSIRN